MLETIGNCDDRRCDHGSPDPHFARLPAERRPAIVEATIAGLAGLLAIGLGLAEFGTSRAEGGAHGAVEVGRFGMAGSALVLMWLSVRLGHNRRGRVSP